MDRGLLAARHVLLRGIRSFFDSAGYLEIDSPLLTPWPTLDANIRSVHADVLSESGKPHRLFLHTSPEYSMKKIMAAGASRIYFLGKVFRDGECTPLHNPEFTMLEWYRAGAGYADLMDETESLVREITGSMLGSETVPFRGKTLDLSAAWKRISMRSLFLEKTGLDLSAGREPEALKRTADRLGVCYGREEDWETLFYRIFLEKVEPGLGENVPVFLTDYPLRLGLNARPKPDDPAWTERVELYMGGLEIANGYTELTDAAEQERRFLADRDRKKSETGTDLPVDRELLEAMKLGLPPCAGIALGVDRLLMLLTDSPTIQDVLLFPYHRWE
jgi:elongation factor P--(R)-beta-lysine ligase